MPHWGHNVLAVVSVTAFEGRGVVPPVSLVVIVAVVVVIGSGIPGSSDVYKSTRAQILTNQYISDATSS